MPASPDRTSPAQELDAQSMRNRDASSSASEQASQPASSASAPAVQAEAPLAYPTGWLVVGAGDISAYEPVAILHLPGIEIAAHRNGLPVGLDEQHDLDSALPDVEDGNALVERDGVVQEVDADYLLVNLPDIAPSAVFDIVYAYASTSRCAGEEIPGVTGEALAGYVNGRQADEYLATEQFAVPCAYRTALRTLDAIDALGAHGYRLLVYDAYRPMTAQMSLSNLFEQAFYDNYTMQASLGSWSLTWYVANGASGHNFGTDLDVGVCDQMGNPCEMPSDFDAFDESGHLTDYPMDATAIHPGAYREEVSGNDACSALHEAFVDAGFTELASEWWHFGDEETEMIMRSIVGNGGLDFVACL